MIRPRFRLEKIWNSSMKAALGLVLVTLLAQLGLASAACAATIKVVAAENVYGDVARQIGGRGVEVANVINKPDQDPHLFELAPTIAREIDDAQIVICNGAGYDPWATKMLNASRRTGRTVITVADLVGKKAGDNPHLWYDPQVMPKVAKALADALATIDPPHKNDYAARLGTFLASLKPLNDKIATIRSKFAGAPVAASEPVFAYMAAALQLQMSDEQFQLATMNGTEPGARDVARFEDDLRQRRVRVVFYNRQSSNETVQRLLELARRSE